MMNLWKALPAAAAAFFVACTTTTDDARTSRPQTGQGSDENEPVSLAGQATGVATPATAPAPDPMLSTAAGQGAADDPSGQPVPAPAADHSLEPQAYAEPVSPVTLKRFPHLAPYQGHILLGSHRVQVIIAGVTTVTADGAWIPTVLGAYYMTRSGWHRKRSLAALDLAPAEGAGRLMGGVGAVDMGVDRARRQAFVTLLYSGTAQDQVRQAALFRLDADLDKLAVGFDFVGRQDKGQKPLMKLRIRGDMVSTISGPDVSMGGMTGIHHIQRYKDTDTSVVLGYRPFRLASSDGMLELTPAQASGAVRPVTEGFELLLTRPAVGRMIARSAAIRDCLYGARRATGTMSGDAGLSWILGCEAESPSGAVRLISSPDDAGRSHLHQPVYVFDGSSRLVAYSALLSGDTVDLALPPQAPFRLADTRSGRLISGMGEVSLSPGETRELALPPRKSGNVLIRGAGGGKAAFLSVERLDMPTSEGYAFSLPEKMLRLADSNLHLVGKWPVEFDLVAGGYELTVMRVPEGVVCRVRTYVRAGKTSVHDCPDTDSGDRQAAADFHAFPFADLYPQSYVTDAGLLAEAGGVSLVAQAAGAGPPPAVSPSAAGQTLRVREMFDPLRGVPVFLASDAREPEPVVTTEPEDPVEDRVENFRRSRGAKLVILGCPGPGTNGQDYINALNLFRPDAVTLSGCDDSWLQERELFQLWGTHAGSAGRTPIPLAAGMIPGLIQGHYFPRTWFPPQDPAQAGDLLRAGGIPAGAGISQGAVVVVTGLEKKAGSSPSSLSLRISAAPEVNPRYVLVYSEAGLVRRQRLQDGVKEPVVLPVPVTPGVRYLRIEVRGAPMRQTASGLPVQGDGALLAASGWYRTKELLATRQQE